jgi:hypothetical protein
MRINKLSISRGFLVPLEIAFEKNTIITSDTNATGKTTLLRFVLYALGYKIPSTKKVDMNGHITVIEVANNKNTLTLSREDDSLEIKYSDGLTQKFDLNEDRNRLLVQSIIFDTDNYDLLKNLLMIMYIDQDKGWTLLNRGKAIGNNRFDVNDFIASLSGIDVGSINLEIKNVESEIRKYNSIKKIISLKDAFAPNELTDYDNHNDVEEKNKLLAIKTELLHKKLQIESKIHNLQKIYKNNQELIDYIASYNLLVRHKNGNEFILSAEDIVDFDANQNILEFQMKTEHLYLDEIKRDIIDIDAKLKRYAQLFDVEQNTSHIINSIIVTDVDSISIDRVLSSLGNQKSSLKRQKNERVSLTNELINRSMKLVEKFTRRLGVYEEFIGTENNYLFTSNLKAYSGSILHKIVFSYRLAFNIVASEVLGVDLPLIIDSPGSAELTMDGIKDIIRLANDYLPKSQIIISTIYREVVNIFTDNVKNIHLDKMLLDL